jgi:hypothetical protein
MRLELTDEQAELVMNALGCIIGYDTFGFEKEEIVELEKVEALICKELAQ